MRPVYKRVDTCAAEFATTHRLHVLDLRGRMRGRSRPPAGRSWCWAAARTASARGSSSTTAACTRRWRCATTATRRSWSTATPRPSRPITTPPTGCTSSPLTLEDVLEIVHVEKPWGVIVQYGGQTPLKLARDLEAERRADHRHVARHDRPGRGPRALPADAPPPGPAAAAEPHGAQRGRALAAAEEIGYPLVVRPSYVLGGRAMEIVHEPRDLERYMREAVKVSNDRPVLLDRFLNDAIEVDVDAVCDGKRCRHRRHHGAHRAGGRPLGRFGVLAAAVLAVGRSCRTSCAARPWPWPRSSRSSA